MKIGIGSREDVMMMDANEDVGSAGRDESKNEKGSYSRCKPKDEREEKRE